MNSEPADQSAHLRALASELSTLGLRATLRGANTERPQLHVVSAESPALSERIICRHEPGQPWQFCWPSRQPIAAVTEPAEAARTIADVLRPVSGTHPAETNDR